MIETLRAMRAWINGAFWRSWAVHGVGALGIAVLLVASFTLLWLAGWFSPIGAAAVGTLWFFVLREAERYTHQRMDAAATFWLDVGMNIAAPVVALAALVWWWVS